MQPVEFSKCECRHCRGHIEFPVAVGGQSIACPHCGQLTELPEAKKPVKNSAPWLLIGLVAIVFGVVLLVVFLKNSARVTAPEKNIPVAARVPVPAVDEFVTNDFAISRFQLERTPGSSLVYVTGTLRNLNDKQRFGVKILFNLIATNETAVGTASDYAAALEPLGHWKFKALVMESKAATAGFNSIREDQ